MIPSESHTGGEHLVDSVGHERVFGMKELEGQVPRWIPVRRIATVEDVAW